MTDPEYDAVMDVLNPDLREIAAQNSVSLGVKNGRVRKWSRSYLYGRSRANRWPLWISWLLAPTSHSRRIVRELMQLRRAGVDV